MDQMDTKVVTREDENIEHYRTWAANLQQQMKFIEGKTRTLLTVRKGLSDKTRELDMALRTMALSNKGWTGELDRGAVLPAKRGGGAAAPRAAPKVARPSGPSASFRQSIVDGSLLCMPGDEEDETADGESIWYANALGPQAQSAHNQPPLVTHSLRRSLSRRSLSIIHHPNLSLIHNIRQEKNDVTVQCGPCKLVKGHYSVPVQWLNLVELTDEHAIFKVWPTEQDRIAATHLMDMPDLKWEKQEEGKYYMSRTQYDAGNDQL